MTGPAIPVRRDIPVRFIGSTTAGSLAIPAAGTVLTTFPRSCYVELGGHIIALVLPDLLRGPLNLVIDPPPAFAFEHLPSGATVHLAPPRLTVDGGPSFDLATADVWDAHLAPLRSADPSVDREVLAHRIDGIKSVLADAPADSLAHPGSRSARAAGAMDALYSGLHKSEEEAIAHGARSLAGLGPGLTPSGDDVLTGVLIALALLVPAHTAVVRRAVVDAVRDRTTRISLAYLDAAARGNAGEAWHLLARALDDGPDDAVATAAAQVMAFGETSGADMLAGFVLAAQALG